MKKADVNRAIMRVERDLRKAEQEYTRELDESEEDDVDTREHLRSIEDQRFGAQLLRDQIKVETGEITLRELR